MGLNRIETDEVIFEVDNYSYDYIVGLLEKLTAAYSPKNKPTPTPTVEISLEDAKNVLKGYEHCFNIGNDRTIKRTYAMKALSEAISKAESKWWGTTEIEQFRESEKINLGNMSKKAGGLNVSSPAIQDQINELREKVDDVQTRLSEIASTVSRSNLSQHIRLGGVEPNNL